MIDIVFGHSNISDVYQILGSQAGSHRREMPSGVGRHCRTIHAARRHAGRRQATSYDCSNVPSKQRVEGSNPAGRASWSEPQDRLAAGPLWQDHNLVFASTVGTPLDNHNVRREFRV